MLHCDPFVSRASGRNRITAVSRNGGRPSNPLTGVCSDGVARHRNPVREGFDSPPASARCAAAPPVVLCPSGGGDNASPSLRRSQRKPFTLVGALSPMEASWPGRHPMEGNHHRASGATARPGDRRCVAKWQQVPTKDRGADSNTPRDGFTRNPGRRSLSVERLLSATTQNNGSCDVPCRFLACARPSAGASRVTERGGSASPFYLSDAANAS